MQHLENQSTNQFDTTILYLMLLFL